MVESDFLGPQWIIIDERIEAYVWWEEGARRHMETDGIGNRH